MDDFYLLIVALEASSNAFNSFLDRNNETDVCAHMDTILLAWY